MLPVDLFPVVILIIPGTNQSFSQSAEMQRGEDAEAELQTAF